VRVSRPCDTSHVDLKLRLVFLFAFLNDLNLILGLAGCRIIFLKQLQLLQVVHVSFIKIIFFNNLLSLNGRWTDHFRVNLVNIEETVPHHAQLT
jgi:hypothetical protein